MIEISLKAETLFTIGSFAVTNSFLWTIIFSLGLIMFFGISARRLQLIPGKTQILIEAFVVGLYDFVDGITQNSTITRRVFPLFATLVGLFLISNLFGLLPLSGFSWHDTPLYRAPTADYSLIFSITIVMFLVWQATAFVTSGFLEYLKKFFNFSSPVNFAMGLLDIIGEIAKMISLSFRLFGNIFAGEAIAAVLLGLAPFIAPIPFGLLGILSGVVQALVFPILVLIFINMAVATSPPPEQA